MSNGGCQKRPKVQVEKSPTSPKPWLHPKQAEAMAQMASYNHHHHHHHHTIIIIIIITNIIIPKNDETSTEPKVGLSSFPTIKWRNKKHWVALTLPTGSISGCSVLPAFNKHRLRHHWSTPRGITCDPHMGELPARHSGRYVVLAQKQKQTRKTNTKSINSMNCS